LLSLAQFDGVATEPTFQADTSRIATEQ
jgi:hypothetical protein